MKIMARLALALVAAMTAPASSERLRAVGGNSSAARNSSISKKVPTLTIGASTYRNPHAGTCLQCQDHTFKERKVAEHAVLRACHLKATFFLRGRCEDYYEYSVLLDGCTHGCETAAVMGLPWIPYAESYKIEE